MTIKRILACVLCMALLLCAVPCTFAFADTAAAGAVYSTDNYPLYKVFNSVTAGVSGAGPYTYGDFWRRDLPIDTTGVALQDLAVQFSIYYEDSADYSSNAFWDEANVRMFMSTEFNAGKRLTWAKEQIRRADGQPLKPGQWNDVVLPFSIATMSGGTYDPAVDKLTFIWPEFMGVSKNTWTVKVTDLSVVDMSRKTNGLYVAALNYRQSFTVKGDGANKASGYSVGRPTTPALDVTDHATANLALRFDMDIQNLTTPGSMRYFGGWGDARIELTSSGTWDKNEISWSLQNVPFYHGKHTYTLKFADAQASSAEAINYAAINFMRAFMVNWNAAMTDTYQISYSNVRIVDLSAPARDVMDNYVVGEVPVANTMSPLASGSLYNYGAWVRDFNINTAGVKSSDLAISARLFYMDTENPESTDFITKSSGELYISDTFVGENGGTRVVWKTKDMKAADGSELKPGVWNDILLPMSTCYSGGTLDFQNKPFTFFWWQHYSIPSSTVVVRMADVRVVDTSRAYEAPAEPEYDTTYLVGEIPYTMEKTLPIGGTFAIGTSFAAIDASAHNPAKLALEIDITATGDVAGMKGAQGQIELTSGGTCDKNELNYNIGALDWEINERTYTVPLSAMAVTGGAIDLSAINYMRMYISGWAAALTGAVNLKVTAVRLVDLTSTEPTTVLPSVFSDGMMFQQNKPMNVFGYGEAGTLMTAELYKGEEKIETATGRVNEDGRFDLSFAARKGGFDKYSIRVYGGDLDETVKDILIGELWIAGGQSNMELQIAVDADKDEILSWNNENVRVFWMPTRPSGDVLLDPARDIKGAYWIDGTNQKVLGTTYVSTIAFVFANKLQEQLGVPVGFLNTALGATQIEAWISREAIDSDPALKNELFKRGLYYDEEFWSTSNGTMATWYNQKVGPLAGLNVAGAIWYQGESNSNRSELYGQELALLKTSWGKAFGYADGNMPFIFTQVAPYRYDNGASNLQHLGYLAENMEKGWALCDADTTSMLTIYDLPLDHMKEDGVSSTNPIHPRTKLPVGERFAAAAMNMVYGGTGEYTAPVYKSMEIKDGAIYITFDRVGAGLKTIDGTANLHGFTVCGADGIYVNAEAVLVDADTVKVWNNRVANPVNATYAFDNFNQGANLANAANIPAAPFRTKKFNDTTLKPEASQSYFTAQDWMLADKDVWVYDSTYTQEYATAFRPSFKVTGGKYSYDNLLQKEGTGALRVDFDGNFTVAPILTYESVKETYANFNSLSVWVMNAGETALDLALTVNGATTVGTVTLAPNANKYQLVTFDLSAVDATSFTFGGTAAAAGTVFFDAFSFGMTAAVVDEATLNAQASAITVDDAAFEALFATEIKKEYTPESVAAFEAQVAAAKAVMADENATLLDRAEALAALEKAANSFEHVWDNKYAQVDFDQNGSIVKEGMTVSAVTPVQIPGTDRYGVRMTTHNAGFTLNLTDIGITAADLEAGQQLAFSVEYYFPNTTYNDTRLAMQFGSNTNYILWRQFGGTSWNGPCVNETAPLPTDKVGVVTFTLGKDNIYTAENYNGSGVTGEYDSLKDAQALLAGNTITFRKYNKGSSAAYNGVDDYYILSVTVFPANRLQEAEIEDVDYEYADYTVAPNPYYPEFTTTVSKGLKVVEHNGETWPNDKATQRFRYYCVAVTDAKSDGTKRQDIELTIYAKEGSNLKTLYVDAQMRSEAERIEAGQGDGYKYGYSQNVTFVDGVAKVVFEDALFLNQLTSGGSIRIRDTLYDQTTVDGAFVYTDHLGDEVRDIARIEVRVLGCDHANTTEEKTDATCTTDGVVTVKCADCGEVLSTETIPATGHNYGGDNLCDVCGEDKYLSYYTYEISGGEATIVLVDSSISGDVVLPSTLGGCPVTSIGFGAFNFCEDLQSVTIPDGVTSIESYAFGDCYSLRYVAIPNSVTSIGEGAFQACSSLRSVTIPDSVKSIGFRAFDGCQSLNTVIIGKGVTSIANKAFWDCFIGNFVISEENTAYSYQDGLLFNKDKTVLVECIDWWTGSYIIPDTVTRIEGSAFEECYNLESVTIPSSVTSIGKYAFWYCDVLTEVYYGGSESDRAKISIATGNDSLTNATWYYAKCDHSNTTTDTVDATCTVDGSITVTCACGEIVSTTVIPATGHDAGALVGAYDPDLKEPGYTGDVVCGKCGEVIEKGTLIPTLVPGVLDENGYYREDGKRIPYKGLILVDGEYYYVNDYGMVLKNVSNMILDTNGYEAVDARVKVKGTYYFDEVGRMVFEKNGVYGGVYYEDGKKVPYAGLVLYEGNYYYVNDNAKVETGRFFASNFNEFTQFTKGYYYFDENGVMNTEEAVIDGYYYGENGKCEFYAGLVKVGDDYYYVSEKGGFTTGRFALVNPNGLKAKGIYYFDTDGKMLFNTVKNGYYYNEEGLSVPYLGLVKASDGNLYYVDGNGKVITDCKDYFVSNPNGYVKKGRYTFDANGVMSVSVSTAAQLKAAIANGGSYVLGADMDLGGEKIVIPAGVSATLNLNGKTLTGAYDGADHYALFTVAPGASLTIEGEGEVKATTAASENNRSLAIFQNGGDLTINGGTYTLTDSTEGKTWIIATLVDNRTANKTTPATLTVNGGDFTVFGNAINLFRNYPQQGASATIIFNGGAFHANPDKATTYIWNQEAGSYLGELYFNGGVYDDTLVYEDYNGQSDIHIADGVIINGYAGNS